MSGPAVSTKEFLARVWGDEQGYAEITVIRKSGVSSYPWFYPQSFEQCLGSILRHANELRVGDSGIYFGVALRREKWPRPGKEIDPKTGRPKQEFRGTEDNALCATTLWADLDFPGAHKGKTITPETAKKLLSELPTQPSCIVHTGGGIQVYWFLKEAATGEDLWRLKSINQALSTYFGTDNTSDLARVFRIPGTMNPKIDPFRPCRVVFWSPDRTFNLDDFDFLPVGEIQKSSAANPQQPAPGKEPRPEPTIEIPEEGRVQIVEELTKIWVPGYRHEFALCIAGMLAYYGVSEACARDIITRASDAAGGETKKRLNDVSDTYRNYRMGNEVKGGPTFDKTLETFPELFRPIAKKVKDYVRRYLPKPAPSKEKKDAEPNFDIVKITMFDSRPAKYAVTIKRHDDGSERTVPCEVDVFGNIRRFRLAYLQETCNRWIAPIKQSRWEKMIEQAMAEVREAPEEGTVKGSILSNLELFLEDRKESPHVGELRTFPGYNETEIFFTLNAFKSHLKAHNVRVSDQDILDVLRADGWESNRRWIGAKNPRLWLRAFSPNGNGHPKGSPQKELFSTPTSKDTAKTAPSEEVKESEDSSDQLDDDRPEEGVDDA